MFFHFTNTSTTVLADKPQVHRMFFHFVGKSIRVLAGKPSVRLMFFHFGCTSTTVMADKPQLRHMFFHFSTLVIRDWSVCLEALTRSGFPGHGPMSFKEAVHLLDVLAMQSELVLGPTGNSGISSLLCQRGLREKWDYSSNGHRQSELKRQPRLSIRAEIDSGDALRTSHI